MSELHRLQQSMMAWLLRQNEAIKHDIVDTGEVNKVSVEQRLAVYGNAYRFRLIDALSDTFPSVHTLMGDEAFYEMGLAYIEAYPSHYFTLRNFGDKLVGFLQDYHKETPVLAEMAEFEWMLRHSFDSADIEAISLQDLQQVPPENWGAIRFQFHPSVTRLDLNWNTPQLWAAIDEEAEPIAPEKLDHPIPWVLSRKELLTYYRSLDVDEAWSLDQALVGVSFADLCEGVCEWVDEQHAPARIAGFVAQWIEERFITGLDSAH